MGSTTVPTPPSTAAPLTKEQFVASANEICRGVEAQVAASGEPTTAQQYVAYMKTLVGALKDGQAKLRALQAPPADRDALEREFLTLNDEQNSTLEAAVPAVEQAAATGDVSRVEQAMAGPFERYGEIAARQSSFGTSYGLVDCVETE